MFIDFTQTNPDDSFRGFNKLISSILAKIYLFIISSSNPAVSIPLNSLSAYRLIGL